MNWLRIEEDNATYYQFTAGRVRCLQSTVRGGQYLVAKYRPVLLKQVHSDIIVDVDRDPNRIGDGMITGRAVNLAVKTADCLPVFMLAADRAAIIHCGWRAIDIGLPRKAARLLDDFTYCLGASINACCYEVKDDVARRFGHLPGAVVTRSHKTFLDLKKAVIAQLGEERLVASLDICTRCHPEQFHSYRRGDRHQRNYALIVHGQ